MKHELSDDIPTVYHTDSSTVLQYIANEHEIYPIFVTNRVNVIRQYSHPRQWRYGPCSMNPADEASCGLTFYKFLIKSQWISGPGFLKTYASTWQWDIPAGTTDTGTTTSESKVACTDVYATQRDDGNDMTSCLLKYFSDWYKLRRAAAVNLKVKTILKDGVARRKETCPDGSDYQLSCNDIREAETAIFQWMHGKMFPQEVKQLSVPTCENVTDAQGRVLHSTVTKSSSLFSLNPFLENNILKVGGRLRRAKLQQDVKHPVILPRKHNVADLVIRHEHVKLGHAGRNHVLSSLREKYWITGGNSAVRHVIAACVKCRRAKYSPESEDVGSATLRRR